MTAIAGLWNASRADAPARCARMMTAQRVYGCGGEADIWDEASIALAGYLPRVRPRGGACVVHGGAGRFAAVADLRLDNREELGRALGLASSELVELSDAALFVRAFERWDEEAIDRLRGDFAVALWDGQRRRLVLARDFLGQRPLHYHRGKDFFAFASMPKGLHGLPEVPYAPDRSAAAGFLALLPQQDERTFFETVCKVPSGHLVTVTAGTVTTRKYWRPSLRPLRLRNANEYAEALRDRFDAAVRVRLRGVEGKVGAHLSAGLDSSSVASTAARLLQPGGERVVAFTAVPGEGYRVPDRRSRFGDEGALAAATAGLHPNIDHVLVRSGGRSPLDALDRTFSLYERPVLSPVNCLWIHAILDEAKARGLSVMLTGAMGNMSLSYSGMELLPELVRKGRWGTLSREALALRRRGTSARAIAAHTVGPFLPRAAWQVLDLVRGRRTRLTDYAAIDCQAIDRFEIEARASAAGADLSYRPRGDGIGTRLFVCSHVDFGNYNKGALAGWGIDVRDPTADRDLFEFCLSVPMDQYLVDGTPRALVRRAMADRLPGAVLSETRKGYQAADWPESLCSHRDQIAKEVERISACGAAEGLCDGDRMKRLVENWPVSGWERPEAEQQYRLALLRGVSVGHFLRKASGSN